jgi:hypothetical protein
MVRVCPSTEIPPLKVTPVEVDVPVVVDVDVVVVVPVMVEVETVTPEIPQPPPKLWPELSSTIRMTRSLTPVSCIHPGGGALFENGRRVPAGNDDGTATPPFAVN